MKCEPEYELIAKLEAVGISRRELVSELQKPYGTISTWLRGFAPIPSVYRRRIMTLITERKEDMAYDRGRIEKR